MDCNANTFLKDSRYAKDKTGPLENFTNTCSVNHILYVVSKVWMGGSGWLRACPLPPPALPLPPPPSLSRPPAPTRSLI